MRHHQNNPTLKHTLLGSFAVLTLMVTGCGNTDTLTNDVNPNQNAGLPEKVAAVHVTDFVSSSILSVVADLAAVAPADIFVNILAPLPHTDVAMRAFGDLLFVINRLGRDSIQIVDPQDNFKTIFEFSTGGGTNPQDIVVLSESKAYITLYNPENDPDADDLLVVNPSTGAVLKKIDLTGLTDDDGDRNARATAMLPIGNQVWILLQDLDSAFAADTNGKIAVLDTATDALVDVDPITVGVQAIALTGRNPSDFAYDAAADEVLVAMTGVFQPDFTTDTGDPYGGIEAVDVSTYTSLGIVVDDADIGGAPSGIQLVDSTQGFTIVSNLTVAEFNQDAGTVTNTDVYTTPGFFLPEILLDGDGHLLITERGDAEGKNAGLVILDLNNGFAQQGPLDVGGPPNALAIVDAVIQ